MVFARNQTLGPRSRRRKVGGSGHNPPAGKPFLARLTFPVQRPLISAVCFPGLTTPDPSKGIGVSALTPFLSPSEWESVPFGVNAFRIFRAKPEPCGTAGGPAVLQSQRDCGLQPRVARNELPWVGVRTVFNPDGVVSRSHHRAATPLGLFVATRFSQGSSFLATLGFAPESLRDSSLEFPKGIRARGAVAFSPAARRPTRSLGFPDPSSS